MKNQFLIIPATGEKYSYSFFLNHLRKQRYYSRYFNSDDLLCFYTNLILCLLHEETEIKVNASYPMEGNLISEFYERDDVFNYGGLIQNLEQSRSIILLQSSGTTGSPKNITVLFSTLLKQVRIADRHIDDVWANAYHPSHMGGLKVFFQAFLNGNTLVNFFGMKGASITSALLDNKVSHISATPTFYKMLLPICPYTPFVKRITLGGEVANMKLITAIKKKFPFAKINNVFACSETGTLLVSNGVYFKISDAKINYLKVIEGELFVHRSVYRGALNAPDKQWVPTGDKVKMVNKYQFRFIGRTTDFINIGGQKVNLSSVQQVVDEMPVVNRSNVFARKNSITGSIICCELELNDNISTKELKYRLSKFLPDYKLPRIIKIVEKISLTSSGKMKKIA